MAGANSPFNPWQSLSVGRNILCPTPHRTGHPDQLERSGYPVRGKTPGTRVQHDRGFNRQNGGELPPLRWRVSQQGLTLHNLPGVLPLLPLEGWRHVEVTDRHAAADYARVLKDLSDTHFSKAKKI